MKRRSFLKSLTALFLTSPVYAREGVARPGAAFRAAGQHPLHTRSVPRWREPSFSDLQEWITPVERFFVRHHFGIPGLRPERWRLVVDGAVRRKLELDLEELQRLPRASRVVTFECAGNLPGGGMVGNAEWSGVPLAEVLERAGLKEGALEVILDGADFGIDEGENVPVSYARSIPLATALSPGTLLALEMNGRRLTPEHGYPLRAVVPGWYAMTNVKWLRRIRVTDRPFRGFYMSKRYFTARRDPLLRELEIHPVTVMGPKSQIARPRHGAILPPRPFTLTGAAWTGRDRLERVEVSLDGGESWRTAELGGERAPDAWVLWSHSWPDPAPGRYQLVVRAFTDEGEAQPAVEDPERINRYDNRWYHRLEVEIRPGA